MKRILLATTILAALSAPVFAARCDGGNCRACKTCAYCKHCSEQGGTCSVCRPAAKPSPKKVVPKKSPAKRKRR